MSNVVALQSNGLLQWALYEYPNLMRRYCIPDAGCGLHRSDIASHHKRILDPISILVLIVAWKESRFVSDEELSRAGLTRSFVGKPLTRNAIGNAIRVQEGACNNARMRAKYAQRATRCVDAAIAFGLIETDDNFPSDMRENCKPLRATAKLAALMVEVGTAFASKINTEMR